MIDGKPITLFIESVPNGCNFYRLKQPYKGISQANLLPCASSKELSTADFNLWLAKADLVVTQCYVAEKFVEYMQEMKGQIKFVVDMDDNIFDVSPFNPSYERNGLYEVDIEVDGKKFEIRDGSSGFYSEKPIDFKDNRRRVELAGECLKLADLVTTPSPVLAGVFKKFNSNVKVLKNAIDFSMWYPLPLVKDDKVRIGWQGGWSHYMDFFEVKEPLEEIMKENPNVILVISGQKFDGIFENIPKDRIEFQPWVNIEVYPWMFKTLNIDIGIAPIENNKFNTCKSEIKWEEYSSLEIPCVASNIPPYSLNIDHEKTGFLASNKKEWKEYLTALIKDYGLRSKISKAAKQRVKERYDLKDLAQKTYENYMGLFRPELVVA